MAGFVRLYSAAEQYLWFNPDRVLFVAEADEETTLVYLSKDHFVRVKGHVNEVVSKLEGGSVPV